MDPYKIINMGDVQIKIYRPALSATEYKRREKDVETALWVYGKATKSSQK